MTGAVPDVVGRRRELSLTRSSSAPAMQPAHSSMLLRSWVFNSNQTKNRSKASQVNLKAGR
jgi:hypothetical protein